MDGNEIQDIEAVMFGGSVEERVAAVAKAMMEGNHVSQIEPDESPELRKLTDNGEESEHKESDF